MIWQESCQPLPEDAEPPDKSSAHVPTSSFGTTTHRELDMAIVPKQDEKDIIMNVNEFKNSLAKPSSIPSRAGAENLTQIIQGKYSFHSHLPTTLSSSDGYHNGPHEIFKTKLNNIKEHIKPADVTQNDDQNDKNIRGGVPLPPCPHYPPLLKPTDTIGKIHSRLPSVIDYLLKKESTLHTPLLRFDISSNAAEFNYNLLQQNNFNLDALLTQPKQCLTSYGSEFKSPDDLDLLFKHHPRWKNLRTRLTRGVHFPLSEMDEPTCKLDVASAYTRGNHKSAAKHKEYLSLAMEKEVSKGWNIILPDDKYKDIPNLILNPMGVADHIGISAFGEFVEKL